jgi:hypothetical protein
MGRKIFLILLVFALPAFAQDKPAKDPAAKADDKSAAELAPLTAARNAYEEKVKEVADPIKADYLKKLDGMKKDLGAKGDTESALAVEREIKNLRADAATIVGKWNWSFDQIVEFKADGAGVDNSGHPAKWTCLDKRMRKFQAIWSHGFDDLLLLSPDGTTLTGASYKRGGDVFYFTAHALPAIAPDKSAEKSPAMPAIAGEKPAKDPIALAKAREAYDAKVKVIVDPIKADYAKKLDGMKKDFGAKGDLASAQAVERELKSVTQAGVPTLVGKWLWSSKDALIVEVRADGSAKGTNGTTGKWICIDKKARRFQVQWSNGWTDWIALSSDGFRIDMTGKKGNVSIDHAAFRLPEP